MSANLNAKIEAENVIKEAEIAINVLKDVLEEETALIKKAKLFDAANLENAKMRASLAYMEALKELDKVVDSARTNALPSLKRLSSSTQELQKTIQINLTVLATARTVSESIIQDVVEMVSRKENLQGYGKNGAQVNAQRNIPIAVSKKI